MLAALLTLIGPAQAQSVRVEYEGVAYGVLPFGQASVEYRAADGAYEARAQIKTSGFAALFARALIDARSSGTLDGELRPALYRLDHHYLGVHRQVSVDWRADGVGAKAEPAYSYPGDPEPTQAQRREGRDPAATLLAMGAQIARTKSCDGRFRVFDGRYIYDLMLRAAGEGAYALGERRIPVVKCRLQQRRVAGYRRPEDLQKMLPEAEIWFAADMAPIALPVRVSSRLPLGVAVIKATAIAP
jgi:hypothetical protein